VGILAEDPDELGKKGEELVSKYMEEAAPRIEPAAVELRVGGVIAGVSVTGYIDLLDVDGCVIDIKTAKARPRSINPMHRFQVATYRYLTHPARGSGRIDTLVKNQDSSTDSTDLLDHRSRNCEPSTPSTRRRRLSCGVTSIFRIASQYSAAAGTALAGAIANRSGAARSRRREARTKSQISGLDSNPAVLGLRIHSLD
jgi:hypothetical protein